MLLGPPVGGALYATFGFRGPFIMGIIFAAVDLVGRLLIIEVPPPTTGVSPIKEPSSGTAPSDNEKTEEAPSPQNTVGVPVTPPPAVRLTFIQVLLALLRSSRAVTASLNTLVLGYVSWNEKI